MKINLIVSALPEHTFSGGIWCILEYAHGLSQRGHEVSVVPILPSASPAWFSRPYGTLETRSKRELKKAAIRSALMLAKSRLRGSAGWKTQFQSTMTDFMLLHPHAFRPPVRSALSENYLSQVAPRADAIIATSFETVRPASLLAGRKFYFAQHFETYFASEQDDPHYAEAVAQQSYRLGFETIANSSWLCATLQREAGVPIVHVCPNAIDHELFTGSPRIHSDSKHISVISYGGRNAKWKGFKEMAQAMAIARAKLPDTVIEWKVYGDALLPPNNSIANYIHLGFLPPPALAEAYRNADILLSASWYESFPLFPLEAMACGLPVITTQPGTEEYAIPGETAEVVEPLSPQSVAAGLLRLINDTAYRTSIGQAGYRISKTFTWKRSVDRLEQIITSQLNQAN